jgi:predicted amidophosphoribosyltransferase
MTRRAERLAEFLTNAGWEVYADIGKVCPKCGHEDSWANYCPQCGKKMPEVTSENDALDFLENALKYALRVDKPAKPGYANGVDPGSFCS